MTPGSTKVEDLYGDIWADDSAINAELDRSLKPRGYESLYEDFAALDVGRDSRVVDVGSRDAHHAIELARRFGCAVIAADPIPAHHERALAAVEASGLGALVRPVQAWAESLPLEDGSATHVWCRDTLNHVDLARGLAECFRVLGPGGRMLVYQTFAGDLMEDGEFRRLCAAMAIVPDNMRPPHFERTAGAVGFRIDAASVIGGEFREAEVEAGGEDGDLAADLLAVSRLNRRYSELEGRFGRRRVEAARADCLWGVYQMLGKLSCRVYALGRPAE